MDRLAFDAPFTKDVAPLSVRLHGEAVLDGTLQGLWRRRGFILAVLALFLCGGTAVLLFVPPQYTSEAIVQLDLSRRDAAYGPGTTPAAALEAGALIQSEARIIRSRSIARRVVEELKLADQAEVPAKVSLVERLRGLAEPLLARILPERQPALPPPATPAEAHERRVGTLAQDLLTSLSVTPDSRSYLVSIGFRSTDPVLAARMANAFAEDYLRWRAQANADVANRTGEWLAAQITETTNALRAAEAQVAAFRERTAAGPNGMVTTEDAESVSHIRLRALAQQLDTAVLARTNLTQRLARVQDAVRAGSIPSAADLQGLPLLPSLLDREATARRELSALTTRRGSGHPAVREAQAELAEVRAKIDAELRRAVTVISGELAAARGTEAEVRRNMETVQRGMLGEKASETELRNLLATAQSARERLASLNRSYEQALAARDMRSVVAALVQPAEPERSPTSPKPVMVMGITLVGGLGFGVIGATLLERRDRGLRTAAELRANYDLRCLGMVPEVPKGEVRSARQRRLKASFDEAVYAVGASVSLFSSPGECRVVLITSSVPEEGKSTLCRALGQALVASGRRVLVVGGAPVRHPSEGEAPKPAPAAAPAGGEAEPGMEGASDAPAGPPALREPGASLTVVDRKLQFPAAADVFGPGGFGSLLADARKHFDVILLEGAPVMLVADSLVLGRLADTVIHVARWGDTRRRVVDAALRKLQEHSIAVDGVVLTRVNLRRHAKYHAVDDGQFYWHERRFYERLAERRRKSGGVG